ncbi:type IV pilus assembly protein PilF [Gammaproteobacteria bacterium]
MTITGSLYAISLYGLGRRILVAAGLLVLLTGCAGRTPAVADVYDAAPRNAAEAYANLGRQYLLRDSLDLAEARLQHAITLNPDLPAAHHDLAVVYTKWGNIEAADKEYLLALKLVPNDPTTLYNYATLLYNQGHYPEAEAQLQIVVANPKADNRAQAYEALGLIALKANNSTKAESYFGQALGIAPYQPRTLLELAQLSLNAGHLPLARTYFQRYQEIAHDTPEGLWLGVLLERAQGDEKMVADYSQRLRVKFPDSLQARQLYAERHN